MNKNTVNTTTTSKALTMDEMRTNRRQQATAIFTSADFTKFTIAHKNINRHFNTLYQEILYTEAEKAVYIALRARHSKSGLTFLADLQNAQSTDRTARNNTAIAEELTDHENKHTAFLNGYNFFTNQANRLTLTAEERATDLNLADEFKRKAYTEQQTINALADALQITFTDRADLTQTAILKLLEVEQTPAPISKTVLSSYGATTTEELTEEEREQAQNTANFRAVINAVGRAISTLTHPDANNRHTTKAEPISAEEVANYILKYGNEVLNGLKIPHTTKRASASQCYITIEERNTKAQKGFYKITHYKTVAPYLYIEDILTTDEENEGEIDVQYIKVDNPLQHTTADIESIEELFVNANLTEQEKMICMHYASATRYYTDKTDIVNYIANREKIHRATVYRKIESIKIKLEPTAKNLHIIK